MIALTSVDGGLMWYNPRQIGVIGEIPRFAIANGEVIAVTALWVTGDKPHYARETVSQIRNLIAAHS